MATYKITGPHRVVEREPGELVSDEDLDGLNVDWLIEVGHISPTKAVKAATQED